MKSIHLIIIGLLKSVLSFSQTTVKKASVLILLVLFSTTINSQTLDDGIIKSISQNWANSHSLNPKITNIICKIIDNEPLLYIVNFEKGWVMIAADESLKPVLGFSFDANYSEENEPDDIKSLFEFYSFVKNENCRNNIKFTTEWGESMRADKLKTADDTKAVEPLITALWNQDWPYNAYVPLDDNPDLPTSFNGHHNTSCGPAAFAQVLNYWQYPTQGSGYHSYDYDDYGTVEADFEATFYNWNNMPVSLSFDDEESVYTDIATLMLHAGVSVDKSYTSGATLSEYSNAAVKYFGYSPTCEVLYRDDFTNAEWHTIYRNDLDNGRPIMMSGCSEGSAEPWESGVHYGHYFVCDGYYGDDFYHINWGWSGSGNGYFPLFSLGSFTYQNYSLIGLEPNYKNKELVLNEPYAVDDNTVALFHFDGNTSNQSTLTDNPNEHGTLSYVDNSALGLGQCLYLDNTNQSNQSYLDIADNVNLDMSGDWTIEMWFKPKSIGTSGSQKFTLLSKPGDSDYNHSNYTVQLLPADDWMSKSLYCYYYPTETVSKNTAGVFTDKNFIELEEWYHLTYIRNTTDKTLKVVIHNADSELIHYESNPYCNEVAYQPLLNSNPLFIGSNNMSNTFFDGYIDELRISNSVREFDSTSTEFTLLAPNGGEFWEPNTNQEISWSYQNIENLKIEYTLDNENTWQVITTSVPASTRSYTWTTPVTTSYECKVKLTDISNVNTYVKSSTVFSILLYELALTSPNGGESFIAGDVTEITWESTPVSNIKIEYSNNNGSSWTEVTDNTATASGCYTWTIPNEISNECLIKITDIADASVSDISENTFNIIETNGAGGPYISDENTILLMHFDGNLQEEAHNYTINNHGLAKTYASSSISDLNTAIHFDNSNSGNQSFISVPYTSELSLTNNWTIEFWLYFNSWDQSHNSWPVPILLPTTGWDSNYFLEVPSSQGQLKYGFKSNDGGAMLLSSTGSIETKTWYHIALINDYDNHTIRLVIRDTDFNTLEEKSAYYTAGTTISTGTQDLRIGNGTAGDNYVDGYMDELRISNIVRSFENIGTGISIELDQELIDKKINALNLHRMKYDLPPFDVEIETILPTEFEAQKPADALSFDAGYVDANGKVYVSEPTSAAQLEVFTDIDQAALYYVCQSFLQYYYQTSEMPIWFKCGFAAYESDMRLDDNDIKTAYNNYGGTLTSFDALNDPTSFSANNGFAVSYIFGEFLGVYKVWEYYSITVVNATTIESNIWNAESTEKLFDMWLRYFNVRILEANEENRVKMGKETEHFKFYYRSSEEYWADAFPDILEDALAEYMGLLEFEVFEKFSYFTMPECDGALLIEGVDCISRYTGGTAWSSGLSSTSPDTDNDSDIERFRGLIRHELGHLTQSQLPQGTITQWLNEGFASFMEGRPLTPEEIPPLQAATEQAIIDVTNFFGHLPSFEETKIYAGQSYDRYLLGVILLNFIYEDGGYPAIKEIMIDYESGIANLGYSSLEEYMTAYYYYLDIRMLYKNVATLNTSLEDGTVYSSSLELNWTPLNPDIKLNVSFSIDGGNHWSEIKSNTTETNGLLEFPVDFYGEFYLKFSAPSILNLETIYGPYQRVNADVLTLLSPKGGEFFIFGDTENIQWEYTNITTIKIEYSTDNGSNWIEVSASTLSSSGSYDWIIPNENSTQCLLKISDIANPTIFDVSDNTFEILPPNNAGGPYASDDNTMLLLHFNGGLVNNSLLSDDGVPNGNTISYSSDALANQNQCLNLDGSSYITIPHNENLNLTGDWTIEAWIKITAYPTNTSSVIVRKPGDTESYYSNYALEIHPFWGNVLHGLYFSDTQTRINITDISPALNKWYHIAFIRDVTNSQIKIIVHDENWDVVSTRTNSYPTNDILLNSQDIRIGESFSGYMDELRISNIVRSFENIGTGIDDNSYGNLISLYPNPSSKNIYISSPEVVDLSIVSIRGRKIIEINDFLNGNIDISTLKKGVYIVVFSCEKGIASKKLIIE